MAVARQRRFRLGCGARRVQHDRDLVVERRVGRGRIHRQRCEPRVEHAHVVGRHARRGVIVGEHQGAGLPGHQRVQLVVLEAVVHGDERHAGPRGGEQRHREQRMVLADVDERAVTRQRRRTGTREAAEVGTGDGTVAVGEEHAVVEPRPHHLDQRPDVHPAYC